MKANLIVGEMDPSRIGVACRAVSHELIPHFQAQPGAAHGYWMVNRTTGEVLVLTIWEDEEALATARATPGANRANVAERTGLGIRVVQIMDVLDSKEPALTLTAAARWARVTWFDDGWPDRRKGRPAERREAVADERRRPGFCGSYLLGDPATRAGLALSFWDGPSGTPDETREVSTHRVGSTANRIGEFESLGVAATARPGPPYPPT